MVTFGVAQAALMDAGRLQVQEAARETVSSGFRLLDALLPAGGVRRGSLIEWLAGAAREQDGVCGAGLGMGAATIACAVACRLAGNDRSRTIVVVDRGGWFHPPAVLPWIGSGAGGVQLIVARPSHDEDEIWAIDQALRCHGVAAVLAWPRMGGMARQAPRRRCGPQQWTIAMRRWQLAARASGAVGLFVRSGAARRDPSWAEARIAVSALPGGTLLERRLLLTRAGGAWAAAESENEHAAEVVFDLARGCEAAVRAGACMRRGNVPSMRPAFTGGASCRAS
jgi:hypothetical protein